MDDATITAAQRGSREAQARLLRELQDPWYRLCLGLLRDTEQARDATQETAVRFLQRLATFRGDSQLRTWSLGIALNVVREARRPRPTVGIDSDLPGDLLQHSEPSPGEWAERGEEHDALHATLGDLPDRQREAVVLRYFEELSTEQTARVMQCAVGTVKATLHQALRSLRQRLVRIM